MSSTQFQFDPTGIASSNLITNEIHPLTEANFKDFYYIIPEYSPFYTNNLIVSYQPTVGATPVQLIENIDYNFGLIYFDATRAIGLPVYASIVFNPIYSGGIITLQYQTLGGVWVNVASDLYTALAQLGYNPLVARYDQIANVPSTFPPINHNQALTSVMGMDDLVAAINGLTNNIAAFQNRYQNDLAVLQGNLELYCQNYINSKLPQL